MLMRSVLHALACIYRGNKWDDSNWWWAWAIIQVVLWTLKTIGQILYDLSPFSQLVANPARWPYDDYLRRQPDCWSLVMELTTTMLKTDLPGWPLWGTKIQWKQAVFSLWFTCLTWWTSIELKIFYN